MSRDSLVAAASKLVKNADVDIDFDPHAFLTLQRGALLAAAVPLPRDVALAPAVGGFARWATLASLSESALYLPVAAAFVRVSGHSQRGMPVPHTSMADGAMSARRVAHRTIPPALTPAAWPMQLHYLEAVDTHFRRGHCIPCDSGGRPRPAAGSRQRLCTASGSGPCRPGGTSSLVPFAVASGFAFPVTAGTHSDTRSGTGAGAVTNPRCRP